MFGLNKARDSHVPASRQAVAVTLLKLIKCLPSHTAATFWQFVAVVDFNYSSWVEVRLLSSFFGLRIIPIAGGWVSRSTLFCDATAINQNTKWNPEDQQRRPIFFLRLPKIQLTYMPNHSRKKGHSRPKTTARIPPTSSWNPSPVCGMSIALWVLELLVSTFVHFAAMIWWLIVMLSTCNNNN